MDKDVVDNVQRQFEKVDRFIQQKKCMKALKILSDTKQFITFSRDLTELQKYLILRVIEWKIVKACSGLKKEDWKSFDFEDEFFLCWDYFQAVKYLLGRGSMFVLNEKQKAEIYIKTMEAYLYSPPLLMQVRMSREENLAGAVNCSEECVRKAISIYKTLNMKDKITQAHQKITFALWEQIIRQETNNKEVINKISSLIIEHGLKALNIRQESLRKEIELILAQCYQLLGTKKHTELAIKIYEKLINKITPDRRFFPQRCIEILDYDYRVWFCEETGVNRYFLIVRNLAQCYLWFSRDREAIDLMEKMLKTLKDFKLPPEGFLSLACFYRQIGDYSRAFEYILKIKLNCRRFPQLLTLGVEKDLELARLYWLCGETEKAEKIYVDFYKFEGNISYLMELAKAFESAGDFNKALFYYQKTEKALKNSRFSVMYEEKFFEESGKIVLGKIRVFKKMGKIKQALKVYERDKVIVKNFLFPERELIFYEASRLYERTRNERVSLEVLKKAYISLQYIKSSEPEKRKLMDKIIGDLIIKFIKANDFDSAIKYSRSYGSGIIKVLYSLRIGDKNLIQKIEALIADIKTISS